MNTKYYNLPPSNSFKASTTVPSSEDNCRPPPQPSYSFQRKEVTYLEYIIAFLISVLASVVGYYICKWLDRNDRQH